VKAFLGSPTNVRRVEVKLFQLFGAESNGKLCDRNLFRLPKKSISANYSSEDLIPHSSSVS
jgi:hypothetical protein